MDRGVQQAAVPGVAKSRTRLQGLRMHEGGASKADWGAGPKAGRLLTALSLFPVKGRSQGADSFVHRAGMGSRMGSVGKREAVLLITPRTYPRVSPPRGLLSPPRAVFVPGLLLLSSRSVVSNSL